MNKGQLKAHLSENVPRDILVDVAKQQRGHKVEELYKDTEDLVNEVLRVCTADTIRLLYEEFPSFDNLAVWFYETEGPETKQELRSITEKRVSSSLREGRVPKLGEQPTLYRVDSLSNGFIFRYAAADAMQKLSLTFGKEEPVRLVNYYSAVFHFGGACLLVVAPYAASKALEVAHEILTFLRIESAWTLLKPGRGRSKEFYNKIKKGLHAFLVETKRHDPSGNYKTIALEARHKEPDLERVSDFKKNYLHADSYWDVLQFTCKNQLGLSETARVKFGYPFGRFSFRSGTSLSAILYFASKLRGVLQ